MTSFWLRLAFCLGIAVAVPLATPAVALTVSADGLPDRPVLAPKGEVKGVVLQFSDITGWNAEDDKLAADMVAAGLIVLPIDLKVYAHTLDLGWDTHDCYYISGDIHDLAKGALRELNITDWHRPILVGRGEGATFVYSTIAVGPDNTFGGTVAIDPTKTVDMRLPTCMGANARAVLPHGWAYDYAVELNSGLVYVSDRATADRLKPLTAARPEIAYATSDDAAERLKVGAERALDFAIKDSASNSLPLVEVPSKDKPQAVAVFWSGDGGWRDIDEEIGDWLAGHGFHVFGIDSLSYFWHKRTPDEVARDTLAVIHRADPTGQMPILLLGFSFGADVIPFAYNRLDATIQNRIKLITMMASERKTGFEITVEGYLFASTGDTDIVPEAVKLPPGKVFCIYGADDADVALCTAPGMAAYPNWKTAGGHHFDGDYHEVANRIMAAYEQAAAPVPSPAPASTGPGPAAPASPAAPVPLK